MHLVKGLRRVYSGCICIVENPVEKVENRMENFPFSSQKRWKTRWKK